MEKFRRIKKEIRILAWDDGPFEFRSKSKTILVGVVFRGGEFMDGLMKLEIDVDGDDAEEKIINIINKSKHKGQVRIMMLDGITFGGFNTVDIRNIYEKTKIPVIVVNRIRPDLEKFVDTIKKLPNSERRLKAVENAGEFYSVKIKNKSIYFQCHGIDINDAKEIIRLTSTRSLIPEPLRIAHLIATGIILGESVGRA
jgi:hypothetical protein